MKINPEVYVYDYANRYKGKYVNFCRFWVKIPREMLMDLACLGIYFEIRKCRRCIRILYISLILMMGITIIISAVIRKN